MSRFCDRSNLKIFEHALCPNITCKFVNVISSSSETDDDSGFKCSKCKLNIIQGSSPEPLETFARTSIRGWLEFLKTKESFILAMRRAASLDEVQHSDHYAGLHVDKDINSGPLKF